jgi:hypothetical protein
MSVIHDIAAALGGSWRDVDRVGEDANDWVLPTLAAEARNAA